jgi:hypothetical protein
MARTARWSTRFGRKCRSYSKDGLWRAMSGSSDGSAAGDRSEVWTIAHARAFPPLSERSTPGDPSEIRRNAPRARSRTSERSMPGRTHATILWSRSSTAGRPQDSCLAPHRTCLSGGPGGQTSISQRAHTIGISPTGPRNNRSALRPRASPMVSTPVPIRPCPASLQPSNVRARPNCANPANSSPQSDN